MRKSRLIITTVMVLICLSGCAKNPKDEIIANKDFDNMIEEAKDTEESVNMEEMSQAVNENYEVYEATLSDDSLNVSVNVDAKVYLPETDKLSMYRVRQMEITDDLLNKVRDTLAPGIPLYDGSVLDTQTKADIENEIKFLKEAMEDPYNEDIRTEYSERIAELEVAYETAPWDIVIGDEIDCKLESVADKYEKNPNEYYSWMMDLTSEGDEVYYGISDKINGEYISLYAQNNADYGNVITYSRDRKNYGCIGTVISSSCRDTCWVEGEESDFVKDNNLSVIVPPEYELTLSMDEAKQQADNLLKELGITDFVCTSQGEYYYLTSYFRDTWEGTTREAEEMYRFVYLRTIDNTVVSNEAGEKHSEGWDGDEYVKKSWPGESITIEVDNRGVVGFCYKCPLEITEEIVEGTQLKDFEQIKSTFEELVIFSYGSEEFEEMDTNIDVSEVKLGYTRISEADNFDSGLLVPAWNFVGEVDGGYIYYPPGTKVSVLIINGIDGSVINTSLGY